MSDVAFITRKGRRALKSGKLDTLPPEHRLILTICSKISDELSADNITMMMQQLIGRFGSYDAAIEAISTGRVGFEKAN
jgi:hypothetical protein